MDLPHDSNSAQSSPDSNGGSESSLAMTNPSTDPNSKLQEKVVTHIESLQTIFAIDSSYNSCGSFVAKVEDRSSFFRYNFKSCSIQETLCQGLKKSISVH